MVAGSEVFSRARWFCAQLAHRLFDVTVEAADGQVPVWHKDARFFALKAGGQPKAYFYLGTAYPGPRLLVSRQVACC